MLTVAAADWSTISSLATGAGTLVLAVATFAAVRSSNRSARIAEVALQEQRAPIFAQSRLDDPVQKVPFVERRWVSAAGGHGVAQHDGSIYFAISLRNVGAGIGVCQAWHVTPGLQNSSVARDHVPEEQFRLQTRDLYIPAGDIGIWQGALRDRNDPTFQAAAEAIDNRDVISVELLYSDQVGAQRTISRFALFPYERPDKDGQVKVEWFATINRHWYLDRAGPRSDDQVAEAVDVVMRERDAAEELTRQEAELAEADAGPESPAEADQVRPAATEPEVDGAAAARSERPEPNGTEVAPDQRPEPVAVITRPNCE